MLSLYRFNSSIIYRKIGPIKILQLANDRDKLLQGNEPFEIGIPLQSYELHWAYLEGAKRLTYFALPYSASKVEFLSNQRRPFYIHNRQKRSPCQDTIGSNHNTGYRLYCIWLRYLLLSG